VTNAATTTSSLAFSYSWYKLRVGTTKQQFHSH